MILVFAIYVVRLPTHIRQTHWAANIFWSFFKSISLRSFVFRCFCHVPDETPAPQPSKFLFWTCGQTRCASFALINTQPSGWTFRHFIDGDAIAQVECVAKENKKWDWNPLFRREKFSSWEKKQHKNIALATRPRVQLALCLITCFQASPWRGCGAGDPSIPSTCFLCDVRNDAIKSCCVLLLPTCWQIYLWERVNMKTKRGNTYQIKRLQGKRVSRRKFGVNICKKKNYLFLNVRKQRTIS